jgi:adenylate cyclase
MAAEEKLTPELITRIWREYLINGDPPDFTGVPWYLSRRWRRLYGYLPQNPRCRICQYPFKGVGGAVMRHAFGIAPSRMNPQLCNHCEQFAEKYQGGAEVEVSILFADVRGSTRLAEQMNPTEFGKLINRFFNTATKEIFATQGMIEKLIGDAVTGYYTTGLSGPDHAHRAVTAARAILQATGHHRPGGPWIPVGIGVHTGVAYVGTVNSDHGMADVAVLGDAANIGARLADLAGPGEIHISQAAARAAGLDPSGLDIHRVDLKGRSEPVDVWVLSAG